MFHKHARPVLSDSQKQPDNLITKSAIKYGVIQISSIITQMLRRINTKCRSTFASFTSYLNFHIDAVNISSS